MNARRLGIWIAVVALLADQISKNVLLYGFDFIHFRPYDRVPVLPFFDLVMVWNRGISYGLFQAEGLLGTVLLTVFQLTVAAVLAVWLWRSDRPLLTAGLGLLIGGALGNAIDRVRFGAVADFFHFYAWGRDWYVFNIADAAITIGVIALLADAFIVRPSKEGPAPGAEPRGSEDSGREPVIRE